MHRTADLPSPLLLPLSLALAGSLAAAQQGAGPAPASREATWPAPTAEDWARPCLVTWQRTFEDALAVSKESERPILICVNMDGEIASEHYAGIRYRQPDIAALYEPYVCVIASVYRHSPRDFDEDGQRIPCPRFGTVTCGEHIAIEPGLFEGFFEDQRVAPRHIMVELDAAEVYDVYYALDTASVFETIKKGIAEREIVPPDEVDHDRPLLERVASRDVEDRVAVETAYTEGDRDLRRSLMQAAAVHAAAAPNGLLRLAVYDMDLEMNRLARQALARSSDPSAVDLIVDALRVPMAAEEREALVAALERLGESSPRARSFATVFRGLARRSGTVDVEQWSTAFSSVEAPAPAVDAYAKEARLAAASEESATRPEDAGVQLGVAEASLALAVDPRTAFSLGVDSRTSSRYALLRLEDARRAAQRAAELGASGWRLEAVLALSAFYLGDLDEAYARAEAAMSDLPAGEVGWNAMAVLTLFAQARQRAIADAVRDRSEWPPEWMTDVNAAYSVLASHPLGTDQQVVAHYDFLKWFGAAEAARVLDAGLERFPESWLLHDRLRGRILREQGVAGLEPAYEAMLAEVDASPNLEWFAGYTSIVAAEYHRRQGDDAAARAAYERAIVHYERSIEANPLNRESADHYVALALAARARLALERGDHEQALSEILASFERRPAAAASLDGLNFSPVGTAQMLLARLAESERTDLAERLQAALDELDPDLLELPEFERQGPPAAGRRRGRQGR